MVQKDRGGAERAGEMLVLRLATVGAGAAAGAAAPGAAAGAVAGVEMESFDALASFLPA
jgi:hypothetical protein